MDLPNRLDVKRYPVGIICNNKTSKQPIHIAYLPEIRVYSTIVSVSRCPRSGLELVMESRSKVVKDQIRPGGRGFQNDKVRYLMVYQKRIG